MSRGWQLLAFVCLFVQAFFAVLFGPEGSSDVWIAALLVVTALNREDDDR